MSEEQFQERTQPATPKRKQKAKEEGQVPRSKELSVALSLLASGIVLALISTKLFAAFSEVMENSFRLSRDSFFSTATIFKIFRHDVGTVVLAILPFFIVIFLVSLLSPLALGGWLFSLKLIQPKGNRINPISGLKRILSINSLVELAKSILKFILIGSVSFFFTHSNYGELLQLYSSDLNSGLAECKHLLSENYLYLTLIILLIACFDIPFQIWQNAKKLKMTNQEIKEENKESELNAEVKGRIKQIQNRISQNRMIREIPTADIVLTNPTHYAVALRYQIGKDSAPTVVAKGADYMVDRIKMIAKQHKIDIISSPALTRSIYFSTDLFKEIPTGLYKAVAQILAYIFQLKRFRSGLAGMPKFPEKFPIPEEFQVTSQGE